MKNCVCVISYISKSNLFGKLDIFGCVFLLTHTGNHKKLFTVVTFRDARIYILHLSVLFKLSNLTNTELEKNDHRSSDWRLWCILLFSSSYLYVVKQTKRTTIILVEKDSIFI